MDEIVIGIDASTTAVKAIAFDRHGREVDQARARYPLANPQPGHFEQDPEDWWAALLDVLTRLVKATAPARVSALSIAHQRETFTLIDRQGKPLIPAILWLDERARKQVARLSRELGRKRIREWSGKPPDPTPALYGLAWLGDRHPQALRDAAAIVDVGGFLTHRLTGRLVTSTASADPLGLIGIEDMKWRPELVAAAGLSDAQLPALVPPGQICGRLSADIARATGLPGGLPVVAGAGDGQAMGLGMGVIAPGRAYLSLGSGVVGGCYSPDVRTSDAFRTMASPTGTGVMLETVLRSGMQLVEWAVRTTAAPSPAALEKEAALLAPGSGRLMVMPYWAGVMSPYWDEAARGTIIGLSLNHTPAHIFRAVLEGIAFEQALACAAMEAATQEAAETMTAAGGGTNSDLLLKITASVMERPLEISPVGEAAALGAAMLAATVSGWYASIEDAVLGMAAPAIRRVEPVDALIGAYRPLKAIYRDIYHATRDLHGRLAALDM